MTIPRNICPVCINYSDDGSDKCTAYPGGIPEQILLGKHDHRDPFPGDNGIRYEPIKDAAK